MNKIYKAHILYTKEKNHFEIIENGYLTVDADGRVIGVTENEVESGKFGSSDHHTPLCAVVYAGDVTRLRRTGR